MLENFFRPRSVAVIGASREPGKVGYEILKNLLSNEFPGQVFPINPKSSEIMGITSYPSVLNVPGPIDLAVVAVPAQTVLKVVEECGQKGIGSLIIISAGFKESGPEGAKLEQELYKRVKELNIRVIGPNCLGVIDTSSNLNASFAMGMPIKGKIAFFSQSGALGTAILDWAIKEKIGFSKFISVGNKMDVNEADLLRVLADDPDTNVILGYIEGVKNGRDFIDAATEATMKKPVVIVKSGSTPAGARAASSHTGTLAGSDNAFQAAFKQCGVLRALTIEALFDYALVLAYQDLPKGNRLAILTNAGGPGIIAADACERSGLTMASFQAKTIEKLRSSLPSNAAIYNPVDVLGDAKPDRYLSALEALRDDKNTDALLVLLTPQAMTEPAQTAQYIADTMLGSGKPVVTSFMGGASVQNGIEILDRHKIPNYPHPERAIQALSAAYQYARWRESFREIKQERIPIDKEKVSRILKKAEEQSERTLSGSLAMEVLSEYGFITPKMGLAETGEEAVKLSREIGYPIVMKIASPDILHKSDIGGVRLGLNSDEEVRNAFNEIIASAKRYMPSAIIQGVTINQMIPKGKEVIIGMAKDPDFGPMLMFGLGGIYVEVLKDVSFRIAPVDRLEASSMISEIKAYPLLRGVRGEEPADIPSIVESLVRLSQLVTDFPEIVEMDINPLMVMTIGKGAVAVDCRITVEF